MTNILTEYQFRHGTSAIPVQHDGVCFFNFAGKPWLIALTSNSCRSFSTCSECESSPDKIIVETFLNGYVEGTFTMTSHQHVCPNADLYKIVRCSIALKERIEPFYAKSSQSLESWLWRFCQRDKVEKYNEQDDLEQMFKSVNSIQFQKYYAAYETFLLSRKYMLFD